MKSTKSFVQLVSPGVSPEQPEVLNLRTCICWSNKPCSSKRCTSVSSKVACSGMCHCRGDTKRCINKERKLVDEG